MIGGCHDLRADLNVVFGIILSASCRRLRSEAEMSRALNTMTGFARFGPERPKIEGDGR